MSTDTLIRSLLIPLNQEYLLLPSAVVVEITHDLKSEKILEDHPDWILGYVLWRNQQVPLLSVEKVFPVLPLNVPAKRSYTIILYGIEFPHVLPFYALSVQDVPRALNISSTHLFPTSPEPVSHPAIVFSVKVNQEISAWLPNLTYLENLSRKSQLNKEED